MHIILNLLYELKVGMLVFVVLGLVFKLSVNDIVLDYLMDVIINLLVKYALERFLNEGIYL